MGKGTTSSYNSAWKKWSSWCIRREVDPFPAAVAQVLEFLTYLFYEGFQYRTINVHRSAISSVLPHVNNLPVGQHHLVKLLMKGILRGKPPLPRYQETWDVDVVLKYFDSLPKTRIFCPKNWQMLLAIPAPKRVSEIARLDKHFMQIIYQGMTFYLPFISKTQKDCKYIEKYFMQFISRTQHCVWWIVY